jgi:hypothetical protein
MNGGRYMEHVKTPVSSFDGVLEGQPLGDFMDVCPIDLSLPIYAR